MAIGPGGGRTSWRLLGCENGKLAGLRIFEEVLPDRRNSWQARKLSCLKAVGVVSASADKLCEMVLDYSLTRTQWDATVADAQLLETPEGKTDILQLSLRGPGPSWSARLLKVNLLRWWANRTDGGYVVFFKSVPHPSGRQESSWVKTSSWLDCGAFIIRPIGVRTAEEEGPKEAHEEAHSDEGRPAYADDNERCVVELVLETDDAASSSSGLFSCCCASGSAESMASLRSAMLHSLAGLREYCNAREAGADQGTPPVMSAPSLASLPSAHAQSHEHYHARWELAYRKDTKAHGDPAEMDPLRVPLLHSDDFDSGDEQYEDCTVDSLSDWESESPRTRLSHSLQDSGLRPQRDDAVIPKGLSRAAASLQHIDWSTYRGTVRRGDPLDPEWRNCWMTPDDTEFNVRGPHFYTDGSKVAAGGPLLELVAVDWLHSKQQMNDLAGRKGGVVQRIRERYKDRAPFFMVLNLQVPAGSKDHYSLAFYFAAAPDSPCLAQGSRLREFMDAEADEFRSSRLTLIPSIPRGSWIVKNAVGSGHFVMLAQVLQTQYRRGEGYFEMDVNMGTSAVVRSIVGLAINCITMLTVDMAFLVKSEEGEPLPEELFGAVRCCNLELGSAVPPS